MARTTHRLYTDGGARGNPGPAGFGVVLETADGELVEEVAKGIGWATNNVAEYEGLIEGLKTALRNDVKRLAVFMDSTLVIQQMKGNFKVKNPGLKPLHSAARRLASQFDLIEFQAIPRERNKHADRLSNEGMDACRDALPSSPPEAGQQTLL